MEREQFIQQNFAEKKGRNMGNAVSNLTCYLSINSPTPNLACLTACYLEELANGMYSVFSFNWARDWDKSIIVVSPEADMGCIFLPESDLKRKNFIPVSTTKLIDPAVLLKEMPAGELGQVTVNSKLTTVDGCLISYFHLINELIWDLMLEMNPIPESRNYNSAVSMLLESGFSVGTMDEVEIINAKISSSRNSVRLYGSAVNKFVPQIMGAVIRK